MIIHLPCFDPCVLFSCLPSCSVPSSNRRVQLNVGLGPNALKLFEYFSLVFLCLKAPSHEKSVNYGLNFPLAKEH